jgi:hypothetical protein
MAKLIGVMVLTFMLAVPLHAEAECAWALIRPIAPSRWAWWRDSGWAIVDFYGSYDACQKKADELEASRPTGYPRRVGDIHCVPASFAASSGFRLVGPVTILSEAVRVR